MSSAIATKPSVVEYVRSLTDEEKKVAIVELFQDLVRTQGDKHTIAIRKLDSGLLTGAAEANLKVTLPQLTPEERAETQVALENLDDTFIADEFFQQLSREEPD